MSLQKLREPFPQTDISKLPKPTRAQTDTVKQDYKKGVRCKICGGWHHPDVIHLDYVGHAALTNRLLNIDPKWQWEPLSVGDNGLPAIDQDGGLWIKLTVCGVTRLGYGDAQGKTGGDAMKERIGDALRNAAMRFGCALELWHKGELSIEAAPLVSEDRLEEILEVLRSENHIYFYDQVCGLSEEEQEFIFANLPKGLKTSIKANWRASIKLAIASLDDLVGEIIEAIGREDDLLIKEELGGLSKYSKKYIWEKFTSEEQDKIREALK